MTSMVRAPTSPTEERILSLEQEANAGIRRLRAAIERVSRMASTVPSASVMQTGKATNGGGPRDFTEAIAWLDEVRQQAAKLVDEAP
jgi:hypothetical protein